MLGPGFWAVVLPSMQGFTPGQAQGTTLFYFLVIALLPSFFGLKFNFVPNLAISSKWFKKYWNFQFSHLTY